jgi:hypothetical protein
MRASSGTLLGASMAVVLLACGGVTAGPVGNADGGNGDAAAGGSSGSASGSSGSSSGASGSSSGTAGSSGSGGSSGGSSTGSGGSSGATDAGGARCTSDAQCSPGQLCGFLEADGCSAQGSCVPNTGALCNAISPGCACDGTEINIICTGLPPGYVSKPLLHRGQCGGLEAGAGCSSDSQCATGLKCCYPCGIPGCSNECVMPDPGGKCPLYP